MRRMRTQVATVLGFIVLISGLVMAENKAPIPGLAGAEADRLIRDSGHTARISINKSTGTARFVRLQAGSLQLGLPDSAPALDKAQSFFAQYGKMFGVGSVDSELQHAGTVRDGYGGERAVFKQSFRGVPVFGGELRVHFNRFGQLTAVNGTVVPGLKIDTEPKLGASDAASLAIDIVTAQQANIDASKRRGDDRERNFYQKRLKGDLLADNTSLYVFRDGLIKGVPGRNHLVYEVEVVNAKRSVREFLYIDAHTGKLVEQITGIHEALDREVSEASLANVIWVEGDPEPIPGGWAGGTAQQVLDWNNEIDGAEETYNLFASMAGRDSYDGAGATLRTVNNDPGIFCPNAVWNGVSTNYCSDVTGDDTVAHEWGHAYTEYTNGLIYAWQSGALNESYSDIWGEVVDLLNGRGTDSPGGFRTDGSCSDYGLGAPGDDSYRWLSGEDDPAFGGAIRDMWTPTCYNDPGKVSDSQYWCSTGDGGGVHTNSGVPNHAFALMVDGGTYNGYTITGIGLTKAAHIHWAAQNMLTPVGDFADHADALEAACSDLTGVNLSALSTSDPSQIPSGEIITSGDCSEVAKANLAVEFKTAPVQCNFETLLDPNAPPLCDGLGSVQTFFFEDWEGGALPAGWSVGTHSVANPPTFDTPDWDVVDSLPSGANGTYAAFVPDLIIGDCGADDESGALYLDSPAIVLPAGAVPHLAFDHWVSTETGWDGGNVKLSVNGSPWSLIPPGAYSFNSYNTALQTAGAGNTNPLAGEAAFSGSDGGTLSGSWGQSQINLIGLAFPGDTVRIRFDFGVDGCNGAIGWYVDDVQGYSCSAEQPPVCGDGILDIGEQCDDGNTADGDGCSSSCQVEIGWVCSDPTPPSPGTNVIDDGSFEAGAFGGFWNEFSLNFGTPLCTIGTCGTGTGTGPSDGDVWAWFGGIGVYEEGSVSQSVTIPATATDLTFDLEQIICDSAADYVEVTIDGNLVFSSDGSSALCGTLGYSQQTIDITAFADDGTHDLEFHSEIYANNGGGSNFFVDNVVLNDNVETPGLPSVCQEIVEDVACNEGIVGFNGGIGANWTITDNTGLGLVWSNIAGSGEDGNYTGGDGDAASVSSDVYGPADFDTGMRTNTFSLANASSAQLDYLVNYQNFAAFDFLDLDISTDGGSNWTTVLSWNEDHGGFRNLPGEAVSVDLSAFVGSGDVQLRWRYYDPTTFDWDWYAQVDNVSLTCNLIPDCGGATPSVDTLWSPNHQFVAIDVNVDDPDGDPVTVTIDSIFQDETVRGPGGHHPDGRGIGTSTAEVRAERDADGDGRVYHIGFTADDGNGGVCTGTVLVGVPHDQGGSNDPVDGGPLYDSTTP